VSRKQSLVALSDGEQEKVQVTFTTTGQNPCYVKALSDKKWVAVPLGKQQVLSVGSCVSLDEPQKGYIFTISSQPTRMSPMETSQTAVKKSQTEVKNKKKHEFPPRSSTPVSVLRQWESDDLQLDTPGLYNQFGAGFLLPPGSCPTTKNAEVLMLSGQLCTERNELLFADTSSSSSSGEEWRGKRSVVPAAKDETSQGAGEPNIGESSEDKEKAVNKDSDEDGADEGGRGDEHSTLKRKRKRSDDSRGSRMLKELEDSLGGGSRCPLRSSSKRIRRGSLPSGLRSSSVAVSRGHAPGRRGCRRM
jgi:hypothetical protein